MLSSSRLLNWHCETAPARGGLMLASFGCGKRLGRDELLENVATQTVCLPLSDSTGKRLFRGVRLLTRQRMFSDGKSTASQVFLMSRPSFRYLGQVTRNRGKIYLAKSLFSEKNAVFSTVHPTYRAKTSITARRGGYPRCTMVLM